jgi:hypothetical protein
MCNLKEVGTNLKVPVYYRLEVKCDKIRTQFTLHVGLQFFCDVLPCNWVIGTHHFKTTWWSHLQGLKFLWTLFKLSWIFQTSKHQAPVTQWHRTIFQRMAPSTALVGLRLTFQNCMDDNDISVVRIIVLNVHGALRWALLFIPWRLSLKINWWIQDFLNITEQWRCSSTSKQLKFSFFKAVIIWQFM